MSDIDSPQHLSSNSKNLTAEEDSSLEWEIFAVAAQMLWRINITHWS
jgi:hypothetical protein